DSVSPHARSGVHCFGAANEHLLRVAPPERARSTKRSVVDDRYTPACGAHLGARDLRRSAGADDYQVIGVVHKRTSFVRYFPRTHSGRKASTVPLMATLGIHPQPSETTPKPTSNVATAPRRYRGPGRWQCHRPQRLAFATQEDPATRNADVQTTVRVDPSSRIPTRSAAAGSPHSSHATGRLARSC